MGIYNVTSKFGFDGDIERGEVYGSSNNCMMKQLECEGTKTGGGVKPGCDSIEHEEMVMEMEMEMEILSVDSSSDEHSESVRLVGVDKKTVGESNNRGVGGRNVVKDKDKVMAMSAKKHPKPPRPPRGLSLDSADQKLIRELHEVARVKRARAERMKTLKRAKEARPRSFRNQLFAALLTILFCLVLFLQGISSRTSTTTTTTNVRETPSLSNVAEQHRSVHVQEHSVSSGANLKAPEVF